MMLTCASKVEIESETFSNATRLNVSVIPLRSNTAEGLLLSEESAAAVVVASSAFGFTPDASFAANVGAERNALAAS